MEKKEKQKRWLIKGLRIENAIKELKEKLSEKSNKGLRKLPQFDHQCE
jgi:hypothetical protein